MNEGIMTWLFDQAPVIIVMGVAIWWLSKRLAKAETEKDKLSNNVIKLTTLWETKATELGKETDGEKSFRKEAIDLLKEIKTSVSNK